MICPRCGQTVSAGTSSCVACGCFVLEGEGILSGSSHVRQPRIPNYIWFSVLMLIVCIPMGAAAMVYSVRVERYVLQQDYTGAREASFKARKINMLGLVITAAATAAYFLLMFLVMLVVK